jgi:hypothetical protein
MRDGIALMGDEFRQRLDKVRAMGSCHKTLPEPYDFVIKP